MKNDQVSQVEHLEFYIDECDDSMTLKIHRKHYLEHLNISVREHRDKGGVHLYNIFHNTQSEMYFFDWGKNGIECDLGTSHSCWLAQLQ